MLEDAPVGSPKWWLRRLDEERTRRAEVYAAYRELVEDIHPLPESTETSQKFARMAGLSTTNLMGLAAEATAERMSVEGIRIGDEPEADKDAWRIWKDSDFDAGSDEAIAAALICERSFVSVSPPKGDGNPRLNYEDPSQVVLAYSPEGERIAALKVFGDEWTGDTFGTLYTPGYVVRMTQRGEGDPFSPSRWLARQMPNGAQAVTKNPLGEVPFFELQNRPLGEIRSELAPLVLPQRLLNQTMFNVQAIAEYGAFRQKWATGIEVPRDPATGEPIAPYAANIASLFVAEGADAKFGDFNATDLKPHLDLAREIAGHMARISRLPATYFLTDVSNVGAETLALIVGGLVAKCQRRVKGYEPGLEGAIRLAFKALGDARSKARIEVKWAEMETRSMAQAADAAVKLTTGDNPVITPQTAQEKWLGMSQTERDRDAAWRLENGAGADLAAIFNPDTNPVA
ncbi:phage portal protein [Nocardioides sp. URHA0032]|uniref:phage portal protein n=1 Tax=Nocardioides sp. URHA0032 TaxID=1380388 RepID=UPI0009E0B3C1|nr:phage portal protein [Nocardioides sp. URHA0032]